jgi:hypothetical protein
VAPMLWSVAHRWGHANLGVDKSEYPPWFAQHWTTGPAPRSSITIKPRTFSSVSGLESSASSRWCDSAILMMTPNTTRNGRLSLALLGLP